MQRNFSSLQSAQYDLVVIGGGIYGACIAWDAALRGLQVALLEREDFGNATSHNSLKLIHGGLRYFQHLELPRIRQSLQERKFWLSMAPHLVRPLKFIVPTFGHGTRGPEALWSAIKLHEWIGFDRNHSVSIRNRVPKGGIISRRRLLQLVPGMATDDLSAGAYWYDGQMLDPNRILIEIVRGAEEAGAFVANYVRVENFIRDNSGVLGVQVKDCIQGGEFEVRGKLTINAAGPWIGKLISKALRREYAEDFLPQTKGMNLVTRSFGTDFAFGVRSTRRSDALIGSSQRLFFVTPLANRAVIGTSHLSYTGDPDKCRYAKADVLDLLEEINAAYPPANLSLDDVYYWYGGLTPAEEGSNQGEVTRSRQGEIIDHGVEDQLDGLLSVIGVKFTTARLGAEKAVNLAFSKLGRRCCPCVTRYTPLPGARDGHIASTWKSMESDPLQVYGSNADEVRSRLDSESNLDVNIIFKARSRFAVDCEMAVRLQDVILRRTDVAWQGELTEKMVHWCADMLAQQLRWSEKRKQVELDDTLQQLACHGARVNPRILQYS